MICDSDVRSVATISDLKVRLDKCHDVNTHQQHCRNHTSAAQYSQITNKTDIDPSRGQHSAEPRGLLQRNLD